MFDVPLKSEVTKLFDCPQNDVMSLCSKFCYDMLKSCWEQAYFLLGGFAVKYVWLPRPNGLELEKAVWHVCSACSEDQIWSFQVFKFLKAISKKMQAIKLNNRLNSKIKKCIVESTTYLRFSRKPKQTDKSWVLF